MRGRVPSGSPQSIASQAARGRGCPGLHGVVGCGSLHGWLSGLPVCLPPIWDPKSGSPGRACDRGLAVARASSLWPGSRPAHASQPCGPHSGMQGSNPSWRQAAPSAACTHLEWDSATLGVSAPAPPPEPMCGMQGGGVLSLIKYSRARSSIFPFYAFRVAVYF